MTSKMLVLNTILKNGLAVVSSIHILHFSQNVKEIDCPSTSIEKHFDGNQSQIDSLSIEIDEELIVHRLKSIEAKPG